MSFGKQVKNEAVGFAARLVALLFWGVIGLIFLVKLFDIAFHSYVQNNPY